MDAFYSHTEARDVDRDEFGPAGLVTVRDLLAFNTGDVDVAVSGQQPISIFYGPERIGKTLAITEMANKFVFEKFMPTVIIIGQNKGNSEAVCADMNARRRAMHEANPRAYVGPAFKFVDGKRPEDFDTVVDEFVHLETVIVTYAGDVKPLTQLADVLEAAGPQLAFADNGFALIMDEADEIVGREAGTAVAARMAQILGQCATRMCVCAACGDVHAHHNRDAALERMGTHAPLRRLVCISATTTALSTWTEGLLEKGLLLPEQTTLPRTYEPRADFPITIVGGSGGNVLELPPMRQTAAVLYGLRDPETMRLMKTWASGLRNAPHHALAERAWHFQRHGVATASPGNHDNWPKPFLPVDALADGAPKYGVAFAIEVAHYVNRRARGDSQHDIVDTLMAPGGLGDDISLPDGAIVINRTGTGSSVWRKGSDWPNGAHVKTLITSDPHMTRGDKDAMLAKDGGKVALGLHRGDLKDVCKYIDWRFGLHVPVVVVTYQCGLKADDLVSNNRVLVGMVCRSAKGHGLETMKQQAGRTRQAYGKLMRLGFAKANIDTKAGDDHRAVCAAMDLAGAPVPFVVGSENLRLSAATHMAPRAIEAASDAGSSTLEFDATGGEMMTCGVPLLNRKRNRDAFLEPDRSRVVVRRPDGAEDVHSFVPSNEYDLREDGGVDYEEEGVTIDIGGGVMRRFTRSMPIAAYPGSTTILKTAQACWVHGKCFGMDGHITSDGIGANSAHSTAIYKLGGDTKKFLVKLGRLGRSMAYGLSDPTIPFPLTV